MSIEVWTIYDEQTGRVRGSGYGPAGTAAAQPLQPGEKVAPLYSNPNTQRVVTGPDGKPTLTNL